METIKKQKYFSPEVLIFAMETEGVVCQSQNGLRSSYGTANEGVDPSSLKDGVWEW